MSLDRTKFSRITVTSDEDDDVVIYAGVRSEPLSAPADEPSAEDLPGDEAFNAHEVDEEVCEDTASSDVLADDELVEYKKAAGTLTDRDSSPKRAAQKAASAQPDTGYRETTAEDLASSPMSLMQKIIIAVAALAVLAIVVYIAFMS